MSQSAAAIQAAAKWQAQAYILGMLLHDLARDSVCVLTHLLGGSTRCNLQLLTGAPSGAGHAAWGDF
jgi:hypothetical protein